MHGAAHLESLLSRSPHEQLAKLEAELHVIRMTYIANGSDPAMLIRAGGKDRTIGEEMANLIGTIRSLEMFFASVLRGPANEAV